ncbi:MAG: hypothetical protein KGJ77_07465 [Acidobacteriota bacterium]|nr:hypothetical protein [Acidobacteriota bacterium]
MLELTALAVQAVATTCNTKGVRPGESAEVTWRRSLVDPDQVWVLDVAIVPAAVVAGRR